MCPRSYTTTPVKTYKYNATTKVLLCACQTREVMFTLEKRYNSTSDRLDKNYFPYSFSRQNYYFSYWRAENI